MTRAVRLLVVDDHPVVAEGIASVLRDTNLHIVGLAATGADAVDIATVVSPDVVLLDLRLPDMEAPEVIRLLRAISPPPHILVFTAHAVPAAVEATLAAGAAGCILKDVAHVELVDAITQVATGRRLPSELARRSQGSSPENAPRLTPREYEILRRVALGKTNAEIAAELFLAANTVKTYWQQALQKLGARNRAEAVVRAHEWGLL